MGDFVNPLWLRWLTGSISFIGIAMNFYLLVPTEAEVWVYFVIFIIGAAYLSFIAYVLYTPVDFVRNPENKRMIDENIEMSG